MSLYIFYFELAAFFSSMLALPYLKQYRYLIVFPVILFVVVAVETYVTFAPAFNAIIYNIQVPVQHALYLLVLLLSMEEPRFCKTVRSFLLAYAIIVPLSMMYFTAKNHINTIAYCSGSIFVITAILMKFYELLQNPKDNNFLKNPFFFLLFAYLLFTVGTLPYFAMGNWLYYTMKRRDMLDILINVMTVFNYILYTTYTLVFLWMVRKKAFS